MELYRDRRKLSCDLFEFVGRGDTKITVEAKGTPSMDYFSDDEAQEMAVLIEMFAFQGSNADLMSEASHQSIRAWQKARLNSTIRPSDTFPNILKKTKLNLSPAEEHFLIERALESAGG